MNATLKKYNFTFEICVMCFRENSFERIFHLAKIVIFNALCFFLIWHFIFNDALNRYFYNIICTADNINVYSQLMDNEFGSIYFCNFIFTDHDYISSPKLKNFCLDSQHLRYMKTLFLERIHFS